MEKDKVAVGMEPIIDLIWSTEEASDAIDLSQPHMPPPQIMANCGGGCACCQIGTPFNSKLGCL